MDDFREQLFSLKSTIAYECNSHILTKDIHDFCTHEYLDFLNFIDVGKKQFLDYKILKLN